MNGRVVIAGASHAGVALADALRRQGHGGEIVLLSDEAHAPYQRPLLSKTANYLEVPADRASLKSATFYAESGIDLRRGVALVGVDAGARSATLSDGSVLAFEHLVFSTGAESRRLSPDVVSGRPPLYLRSLDDARNLHSRLTSSRTIAVIGGGLIGLEVASLAAGLGRTVTVYEAASQLMGRVVPKEISDWLEAAHRSVGIEFRLGSQVTSVVGDDTGYAIATSALGVEHFDGILVAIGTIPRSTIARDAGLEIKNGICVNSRGQASKSGFWALGDCADWGGRDGVGQRFEGVQPALEQARTIARAICGQDAVPPAVPRYWSHQGPIRLQTAGALSPDMVLAIQDAEAGGICLLGLVNGVPKACFAVDAANAYRDAVKVLDTARQTTERASA